MIIFKRLIMITAMVLLLIGSFNWNVSYAAQDTTYSNSQGVITLQNSLAELKFSSTNGAIMGIKNKDTGTQFIGGTVFSSWTVFLNTRTGNKWQASLGDIMAKGKDATSVNVSTTILSNGITVNFEYTNVYGRNITITTHVTLYDNNSTSEWTADIVNNEANTTVTAFIFPEVAGINTLTNEKLAWPYREGKIYDNPGTALRMLAYPMPASMQWMSLYSDTDSLYYAVLDKDAVYKEFRFGYDPFILPSAENPRQMSATLWPYVQPTESYTSPVIEIGVSSEGNWYWGADQYREFINTEWVPQKHGSTTATSLGVMYSNFVKIYGQTMNPYNTLANTISQRSIEKVNSSLQK